MATGRGATVLREPDTESFLSLVKQQAAPIVFRKGHWISLAFLFVLLFGIANREWLVDSLDHEISAIEVQGAPVNFTLEQLESRLQNVLGESFLFVDLSSVKQAVEQEPWVFESAVTRVWPGRLVVNVQEQKALAVWNGVSLINERGDVFTPDSLGAVNGLPELNGPPGSTPSVTLAMLSMHQNISAQLAEYGLALSDLSQGKRGDWEMGMKNGLRVLLGSDDLSEKVARFGRVYETQLAGNMDRVARVDARYPNGLAVAWKQDLHAIELAKK